MGLFATLEGFAHTLVDFLGGIQIIFFESIGDAISFILDFLTDPLDPLYGFSFLFDVLLAFKGAIANVLGIDLLFFLDFSLSMFFIPTVLIVFIVVLFIISVWKLILELIPFA